MTTTDLRSDEALVLERLERFLVAHDPAAMPREAALGAQFDAGLAWVHFPEGCGGLGVSPKLQGLVGERLAGVGAPQPTVEQMIGVGMGAPTLATYATGAFRERHLRAIFTGEEIWCQLFSEPG